MTNSERAAAAAELKATGQCNCTQAVLKVFEDRLPVDSDTLMKLTAGYAAGMGCMGEHLRSSDRRRYGRRYPDKRQRHAPLLQGVSEAIR